MAEAANAQNIQYFSVSCHAHTPIPDDDGLVLPRDMTAYRAAIAAELARTAGFTESAVLTAAGTELCPL